MNRALVFATKALAPLLVVGLGVVGVIYLVQTRPQLAPTAPREKVWVIAAETVELTDVQPQLRLYGEIVAGREVELRALVAGEVVEVAAAFREGGRVERDALLVAIDPFEYQAALDERIAQLDEARARLEEISARRMSEDEALARDKEMLDLRQRDLARVSRLHQTGNISDRGLDNAKLELSRQRQAVTTRAHGLAAEFARMRQQRAKIEQLEVSVRRARRALERTRLVAPFAGFLSDTAAEIGKRLGVNDRVGRLIEAGYLEVRVHISDAQYGRILESEGGLTGRVAKVIWRAGLGGAVYDAVVERVGARIDAATGGVSAYARILTDGSESPLRPGAFVEVWLPDRVYPAVARLPESTLHGGTTVYVVEAGRLAPRLVELAGRDGNHVLLRGALMDGERVVVTRFAEIGPGVAVEMR